MYAVLSPRILAGELKIDRARAERLLDELERRGAVGQPFIAATGARESRVNIVEDRPAESSTPLLGTEPRLGRRTVVIALATALLGLGLELLLHLVGAGEAVGRYFRAEIGSPILFRTIGATLPLLGLLVGWLVEMAIRPAEDLVPGSALRLRGAVWTAASILGVGFTLLRLLS